MIAGPGAVHVEVVSMPVSVVRIAAASAAVALALSGCGAPAAAPGESAGATNAPAAPAASASAAPSAQPSGTGPEVPDTLRFTAPTVDGGTFDGATLAGRPAVLWFWAAWCPRCRAAAGEVAAVSADYSGRARVVGVAGLGSGAGAMKKFVADTRISGFPSLADDQGTVWGRFGVTTQEYFVIIDGAGQVVHKGPLTGAELRRKVDALAG